SDWAVSAEHRHAVLALAEGEFVGGGELHLVPFVHKTPDNLEVLHVLPGGKFRCRCCNQPSLAIHHVRSKTSATNFLQAPNQELQIHDRANHAEKTIAIHDRRTDQHDRASGFATAHQ